MNQPILPTRAGDLALSKLIDLYMAYYEGRDVTRVHRVSWWREQLAELPLRELTDDRVFASLQLLGSRSSRYYAGKDADGRSIYKARPRKVAPATVNRYAAALGAVITWAIKCRIAPVGFVHPCRTIERKREDNEKTRFLSDEERARLLVACKASRWPRLYVLVLMALTTGARKGELLGLRWGDVDLASGQASVRVTKNGDPRVLPLTPAVIEELKRFKAGASSMVFASPRDSTRAFAFGPHFAKALEDAKVRNFRFHDLRHSCASLMAQSGRTLLEIADLLGHRQLQVTKRYSHLATGHKKAVVHAVFGAIA